MTVDQCLRLAKRAFLKCIPMRRPLLDTHRLNPTLSAPHAPCLDHGVKPLDAPIDLPKQNHALILHGVQEAVEQAKCFLGASGKLSVIGGGVETAPQQMVSISTAVLSFHGSASRRMNHLRFLA